MYFILLEAGEILETKKFSCSDNTIVSRIEEGNLFPKSYLLFFN